MKVRLPIVIKDHVTSLALGVDPTEDFFYESDEVFLDGPVTRKLAVLDFDPASGSLSPAVPFELPRGSRTLGRYAIPQTRGEVDTRSIAFIKVSVFATVLKTMEMFQEPDTLGRALTWAFNGPQLLIVPRAGEWTNAYYERESHSLQFFQFPSARVASETVYTSLSHDIVAHETGHAIFDGIAPELYHAVSPQSLALHEAVADLVAAVMAFRSNKLRIAVLNASNGSIQNSEAFSGIGEEFHGARDPNGHRGYLRNLRNERTLDPDDKTHGVDRSEPHALSEVLSGALYAVMLRIHADRRSALARRKRISDFSASGEALATGADRFKRMIFRALDYLPPGEVSFADYGRAIIAADQASHPGVSRERGWIADEFERRKMVASRAELEVETGYEYPPLKAVHLSTLVESDWAAYAFANENRSFLGIPAQIPFRVYPRLHVAKLFYTGRKPIMVRECLLKVSWDVNEPNPIGGNFPANRQITIGTTLAINWSDRKVRARLTSDLGAVQREDRDRLLTRLAEEGVLRPGSQASWAAVRSETMDGLMRVRGAGRLLHIAAGDEP
jgi:hypothetical protein